MSQLNNFHSSDVLAYSVLECRVYAKHKIGSDDFIGGTKDVIESLLTEGAAQGLHILMLHPFANMVILSVITRQLCKQDTRGNQHQSQTIVEFTIVAISKASDAAILNMEEAVMQENNVLDRMKLVPSLAEPIQGAVNTSATGLNDIKSMSDTWGLLLHKIKLFSALVDSIVEVRD